jgi:hypothetical protein
MCKQFLQLTGTAPDNVQNKKKLPFFVPRREKVTLQLPVIIQKRFR